MDSIRAISPYAVVPFVALGLIPVLLGPSLSAAPIRQGDPCATSEVRLSTGYDHLADGVLSIGSVDARWTVVLDPFPGTLEPRPAAVIQRHPAWRPAEPESQWISGYPTSSQSVNGLYVFETRFCLRPGVNLQDPNARIEIGMRADDACRAYLNGVLLHVGQAFHSSSLNTVSYPLGGAALVGENVLRVEVDNTGSVAMGLNAVARVFAAPNNTAEKPSCCAATGALQGRKFNDLDGDGQFDPGEPALSGWRINLAGNNGVTAFADTDSEGYYSFVGLPPGFYSLTEQQQPGWTQTYPSAGFHGVTLSGLQAIRGLDFGNHQVPPCSVDSVALHSGFDHAGGGTLTYGDIDPRWKVVQDPIASTAEPRPATVIQRNAAWQTPEPLSEWISGYPSSVQSVNGTYVFETTFCLRAGFAAQSAQLALGMRADDACRAYLNGGTSPFHIGQSFGAPLLNTGVYSLAGIGGVVGQNTLRIEVDNLGGVAMGLNIVTTVTAPNGTTEDLACCSGLGALRGLKFNDVNGNGLRDLGEPALAGWTIRIAGSNGFQSSAVTDGQGFYAFVDLPSATYTLTEDQQPSWTQTAPSGGSHLVTITGIQGVAGLDFGNHQFGPLPYCTGGTTSNGCNATISASGAPRLSATSGFTLICSNVEGAKQGLILYGVTGAASTPWGSSLLCVKAPIQRTTPQNSGGSTNQCNGALSLDWLTFVASNPSALGAPFLPGDVVSAQGWFRDPPAPKQSNLSNALQFICLP